MRWDVDAVEPMFAYKLLTATVTPRPIAWVTTLGPGGVVNAAPYSFFNVMGPDPATAVLGVMRDPARGFKDTARNIMETAAFVINLVPERLAQQMNLTCMDAPPDVSELDIAGLTAAPSTHVPVPRIAESPVSFECALLSSMVTGPQQTIVIGRILAIHIDDAHVLDAARGHVDTPSLNLIARMHGSGWYTRANDLFQIDRQSYADWKAGQG